MKASIDYKTYRENEAIAPSDIKLFGRDIAAFYKTKILKLPVPDRKTTSTIIGDLADLILTQPKDIDKLYYILTDWKATEKVKEIVDKIYEKRTAFIQKSKNDANSLGPNHPTTMIPEEDILYLSLDDINLDDILTEVINEVGYYNNWTMDKRKDTVIEKGKGYFEQLKEVRGRDIVPIKIYNKAVQAVERARQSKDMQDIIWTIERTIVPKNIVIKTQVAVYGSWQGIKIKGLIDVLWIDMRARTIQMIEIKTSKLLQWFLRRARMSRYDVQVDMYQYILELITRNQNSQYHDFKLLPPKFLVIPIEGEQQPEWFQFTEKDYTVARRGYDIRSGDHIYGWTEALNDIQWHKQQNKWEHHRKYYEANMMNVSDLWSSGMELPDDSIEEDDLFTNEV